MRLFRLILFFLWPLIVIDAAGQKSKIDSLKTIVSNHPRDTIGIHALIQLSTEHSRSDLTQARSYSYQAIDLAKSLNTIYGLSASYSQLTAAHNHLGQLDSVEYYLTQQKILVKNNPGELKIGINYNNSSGLFYKSQGKFKEALPYLLEGLRLLRLMNDNISLAGQLLNIGNAYHNIGDLKNAADYHLQALELFEVIGNKRGQSFCLQSLANDFIKMNRFEDSRKYLMQSLSLKLELKDDRGLISSWSSLGNVYAELGKFKEAETYHNKALAQARLLKLTTDEANALYDIGDLQKKLKRTKEAKSYFRQSLALARQRGDSLLTSKIEAELALLQDENVKNSLLKKINTANLAGDKLAKADAYLRLAEWNFKNQKFEEAFNLLKQHHQFNDSIRGGDVLIQLKQLEELYQSEKKEKEIILLKKDQEIQALAFSRERATVILIAIVLLSVIIISFLLVNRFRVINRTKRQMEMEIMRNNIARDLHDDIGSTLSSINIISQLAMQDANGSAIHFQRIAHHSSAMMESMSDIVWSINPNNDSLDQVIIKMKEFASEILDPIDISFSFCGEENLFSFPVDATLRKNIFLIFKEALNNIAKYSSAKDVTISFTKQNQTLQLSIADNGKGFDTVNAPSGNGLRNMSERAKNIHAELKIKSLPSSGTEIVLKLPLT